MLLSVFTMAQSRTENLNFSVFANPSVNWLSSDVREIKNNGVTVGFDAGLTVDKFFAEKYAFTSGISIGSSGGSLNFSKPYKYSVRGAIVETGPDTKVTYTTQYLSIPIGLKFKSLKIGYLTYFAHVGLNTQYRINAKGKSSDYKLDDDNIKADINFFNMGFLIGGGVEYSLGGNTALIMGLTYYNGFLDITQTSDRNLADKITSSSVALRLGILF